MSAYAELKLPREPKFPTHNAPRAWFITCANSPIGIGLCRQLLAHGDCVTAGVHAVEFERDEQHSAALKSFLSDVGSHADKELWRARLRVLALDTRSRASCQAAIAEAAASFGRIDILFCCDSEAVVGTIEELGQTERTRSLMRDQFETNFFGPVNIITAALPGFRARRHGHIILLTAITGHLGTPGLGMYCASQWAIEGYCDSLAYEIAPFNVKVTIVQPNAEVALLMHRITAAPPMEAYTEETNPAPLSRNILSGILDRLEGTPEPTSGDQLHGKDVVSLYPALSRGMNERLVAETIHAIVAIGGHDNPPARHIVGAEGVATVKEKLRTVSEELEEFINCSLAVDIDKDDGSISPQATFSLPTKQQKP